MKYFYSLINISLSVFFFWGGAVAAPIAYGNAWARDRIQATAAALLDP